MEISVRIASVYPGFKGQISRIKSDTSPLCESSQSKNFTLYLQGFEFRNTLLVNPINHLNCASTIRYEVGVNRIVRQTEFVPK